MIGRTLFAALLFVGALAVAVFATRRPSEADCITPVVDEHGYLIPAPGPCNERRGSLVVHRELAGV